MSLLYDLGPIYYALYICMHYYNVILSSGRLQHPCKHAISQSQTSQNAGAKRLMLIRCNKLCAPAARPPRPVAIDLTADRGRYCRTRCGLYGRH